MPAAGGVEPETIWEGDRWDQAYNPSWSPDGKHIVFSTWTKGGYADIYLYDVATKKTRPLTHDRAIDVTPRFSPDGKLVYFSSDRTGIYNLYALELGSGMNVHSASDVVGGKLWQVSNVIGGVFEFDVSPDGKRVVYTGFEAEGYELYELEIDRSKWLPAEPYLDDRPDPVEIPDDEVQVSTPRDYAPTETLLPLSYSLSTTMDSFGNAVTLSTGGSDVVGLHSWSLGVTYGARHGDVDFGVGYSLNKYWAGFGISAGRSTGLEGGLVLNGRNTAFLAENYYLSAGIGLPVIRRPEINSDLSLNYDLTWERALYGTVVQDPSAQVPILPRQGPYGGVTLTWSLSNERGFTFTLGPVEGRGLSLQMRLEDPAIGSRSHAVELLYRWDEYWGCHGAARCSRCDWAAGSASPISQASSSSASAASPARTSSSRSCSRRARAPTGCTVTRSTRSSAISITC